MNNIGTKIVVVGFQPFDGVPVNPSMELVQNIEAGSDHRNVSLVKYILPVCFLTAGLMIRNIIEKERLEILLIFGADASQDWHIKLEMRAVNVWQDGCELRLIDNFGPDEYITRLPAASVIHTFNKTGIPAITSASAGLYVCNYTYYTAARQIDSCGCNTAFGLIHLPARASGVFEKMPRGFRHLQKIADAFWPVVHQILNVYCFCILLVCLLLTDMPP